MKKHPNRLQTLVHDHLGELHNVTWPTQKQALHSMILVLVIMLLVGGAIAIIDYLLSEGLLFLLK